MGIGEWISQNWFDFFSVVGIVGGLWFTAISLYLQAKAQFAEAQAHQVANLLTIAQNHRELWFEYLHNPDLRRIRDAKADLQKLPVTEAEHVFVNEIIIQANTAFHASNHQLVIEFEGMKRDMIGFFALPVPGAVWLKVKPLQNRDFAQFIEGGLK